MLPVTHTSAAFSKKAHNSVAILGARTVMILATMTINGPMTRAKARVRAAASGVAGINVPHSLRLRRGYYIPAMQYEEWPLQVRRLHLLSQFGPPPMLAWIDAALAELGLETR
jgi:hypothetical protein